MPEIIGLPSLGRLGEQHRHNAQLRELYIVGVLETEIGNKSVIVVYVPFPQLKQFHKVQVRLVRELEKKFGGKHVFFLAKLEGVPHSLSPKLPPLFPSWTLTCIGPNSYYTHSYSLRVQPNLKLGGEYLYPVDPVSWDRDMQYVQAVEGVSSRPPPRKPRRLPAGVEKVKLFVGMEYECPRGHRFFVAENGEPLRLPKNSNARSALNRESDDEFLHCDFPLRRQCMCRKLPVQTAQLMRVYVVTPKAPITVTIQPSVEIPGQEGCFGTGEGPLQLSWARYYILQLPSYILAHREYGYHQ